MHGAGKEMSLVDKSRLKMGGVEGSIGVGICLCESQPQSVMQIPVCLVGMMHVQALKGCAAACRDPFGLAGGHRMLADAQE